VLNLLRFSVAGGGPLAAENRREKDDRPGLLRRNNSRCFSVPEKGKTTWILLSGRTTVAAPDMEKTQEHIQSLGIVAQASSASFFEGTTIKQLETRFANGFRDHGCRQIPTSARGYSGHVTLDEFAFHADAEKIYAALYPDHARLQPEVISTPNGQQGKFFDLAQTAGLANGTLESSDEPSAAQQTPPSSNRESAGTGVVGLGVTFIRRARRIKD